MNCTGVELGSVTCGHDCTAEDQAYNAMSMPVRIECHGSSDSVRHAQPRICQLESRSPSVV